MVYYGTRKSEIKKEDDNGISFDQIADLFGAL